MFSTKPTSAHRLQRYRAALPGVDVVYAAKSLLCTAVARWATEAGAGLDVSSAGELATALVAGADPARIVMHGNAKSVDELRDAAVIGVGRIVVDSLMDIAYLSCEARRPLRRADSGHPRRRHPRPRGGDDRDQRPEVRLHARRRPRRRSGETDRWTIRS